MSRENSRDCDLVQDLLPLYLDDACSESSKKVVKEHLAECAACREVVQKLKDHTVEDVIAAESESVLAHHAKRERTAAFKAGVIIAGLLILPVLITLIVGMANGGGLGVFFVTLASMLLVGAMTAVPLLSLKNRLSRTILCGVGALLLILFFVDRMNGGGGFLIVAIPTILGLSVPLFPVLLHAVRLPAALSDKKGLLTMAWDTVWLFLTICIVCVRDGSMEELRGGLTVAAVYMLGVWLVFGLARYAKLNRFKKAGCIAAVCGLWTAFGQDICNWLLGEGIRLTIRSADFSSWNTDLQINANVYLIVLTGSLVLGGFLFVAGLIKERKRG